MWSNNVKFISLILIVLIPTSHQNIYKRRTSNTCRTLSDCPENAFCDYNPDRGVFGVCVCNEGYLIEVENRTSRECHKIASTIHDQCHIDNQCMITLSTDSECKNGQCQCRDRSHYVAKENACYKSVKIGDYCQFTNNCLGDDTICRYGKCICPLDTHPNYDSTRCLRDIGLSNFCSEDDECITDNSRCHNICRCRISHIISANGTNCLKVAGQLYDECTELSQCNTNIPHSICNKIGGSGDNTNNGVGVCTCQKGYHEINYQCFVTVELNGICETNENCRAIYNDDQVECINGRCECIDELCYTYNSGLTFYLSYFNVLAIVIGVFI